MVNRTSRATILAVLLVLVGACAPPAEDVPVSRAEREYVRSVFGPTWTLVALNAAPPPPGNRGRPATMEFYSGTEARVNGFTGCNQWSSTWSSPAGDSLRFAPPTVTRMACAEGMELEARFLRVIEQTRRFAQRDSSLVLYDSTGDSARFVAR